MEQFFHDVFSQTLQFNRVGSYWNRSGTDEIDLIAINDLEKRLVIAEIKLNKSKISLSKLKAKAETFIKSYSDYDIEFLGLSLEDAGQYF